MSGTHRHEDYEDHLTALDARVDALLVRVEALENDTEPPPVEPEPEPPPTGDRVYNVYGFRKGHPHSDKAVDHIEQLGRVPKYFRHVIAHTETRDGVPMFTAASSTARAYWSSATNDMNLGVRYPQMATSTISPTITKPTSGQQSAAQRTANFKSVLAGNHDSKLDEILAQASQAKLVHRFCLNSEPDLASWPYTKHGIDADLWCEAFGYVAHKIRTAGHLVVYACDGSMYATNTPNGEPWWEYALPHLDDFDIFGQDLYINKEPNTPQKRLAEGAKTASIAKDLGKKVAFPEWGVTEGVYSDDVAIGFMADFCDLMGDMAHLDHHVLWDDNDRRQTPAMKAWVLKRFGAH